MQWRKRWRMRWRARGSGRAQIGKCGNWPKLARWEEGRSIRLEQYVRQGGSEHMQAGEDFYATRQRRRHAMEHGLEPDLGEALNCPREMVAGRCR